MANPGFVVPDVLRSTITMRRVHTEVPAALAGRKAGSPSPLHAQNSPLRGPLGRPDPEVTARLAAHHENAQREHGFLLADVPRGGLAEAIITLHAPTSNDTCEGCDGDGWESEPPQWPCRTYRLTAQRYGRTFTEDDGYGVRMVR